MPLLSKVCSDLRSFLRASICHDSNWLPISAKLVSRGFLGDAVTRDFGIPFQRRPGTRYGQRAALPEPRDPRHWWPCPLRVRSGSPNGHFAEAMSPRQPLVSASPRRWDVAQCSDQGLPLSQPMRRFVRRPALASSDQGQDGRPTSHLTNRLHMDASIRGGVRSGRNTCSGGREWMGGRQWSMR